MPISSFEEGLAAQEGPALVAAEIESETCRGATFVRVTITAAVDAIDVADAIAITWDAFRAAAGDDDAGWDMASASAEIRPEEQLATRLRPAGPGAGVMGQGGPRDVGCIQSAS